MFFFSKNGNITCVTGEMDIVVGSGRTISIQNGHAIMTKVTALGCSLSAVVAAYLAVATTEKERHEATTAALAHIALSGELAAQVSERPGSFAVAFLDKLDSLTLEDYKKYLCIKELTE
jgi:hydroxyethylthiazole kinase